MSELKENESMNIYSEDCPYIEIQWQEEGFFVSNAVLKLIGNPDIIRFQWNATQRTLIIEPTNNNDPNGIFVTELTDTQQGVLFIGNSMLFYEIWHNSEWNDENCYRVVAKYNVPSNLAIFDIKKAIASDTYIDYDLG